MSSEMKHHFQLCTFKISKDANEQTGIAKVAAFGLADVEFIIDSNGNKVASIYDYWLFPPNYEFSTCLGW